MVVDFDLISYFSCCGLYLSTMNIVFYSNLVLFPSLQLNYTLKQIRFLNQELYLTFDLVTQFTNVGNENWDSYSFINF